MERATVEHRRHDPLDANALIEVLAHHRQGVLELHEPAERQVLALHGDDHSRGGDESVDGEQPERRRRVHEDVVVAIAYLENRLLQRPLATDQRGQRELRPGKVDRGHGDVHLASLDHVRDGDPVDEHVEHRALDRVRVQPLAHRQIPLRIEVDQEHTMAELGQGDAEVQRGRGLRHPALLVGERDHACPLGARHGRLRRGDDETGGGRRFDGRRSAFGLGRIGDELTQRWRLELLELDEGTLRPRTGARQKTAETHDGDSFTAVRCSPAHSPGVSLSPRRPRSRAAPAVRSRRRRAG